MQIEKINNNQLEVILNLNDLTENNISLHSFMCNVLNSKDLLFNILGFANKEIGFSIKNHEIVIEAFSLPEKSSFVLLITRIPKTTYLHLSKHKYGKYKLSKSFWIKFNCFEDFCMFCNFLKNSSNIKTSLFFLDGCYFLYTQISSIKNLEKTLLIASEFSNYIYNNDFILDENAEAIIKNFAIETSKKYFV